MYEVLVYLFENYYQADLTPDHGSLQRKLAAAGFENEDVHDALDWLKSLTDVPQSAIPEAVDLSDAFRGYSPREFSKLSSESRGFIAFLESAGVLTPILREIIIERAMAVSDDAVGLDKIRVIVLMVLWTQHGNVDTLILDELLPDGSQRQVH
jgi:Smg protein